jgi:hypothetical protein
VQCKNVGKIYIFFGLPPPPPKKKKKTEVTRNEMSIKIASELMPFYDDFLQQMIVIYARMEVTAVAEQKLSSSGSQKLLSDTVQSQLNTV